MTRLEEQGRILRNRRDTGELDDAQYWGGMIALAAAHADTDDLTGAVRCLCQVPEAFLLVIPESERPLLQDVTVRLAEKLRASGIVASALPAPKGPLS